MYTVVVRKSTCAMLCDAARHTHRRPSKSCPSGAPVLVLVLVPVPMAAAMGEGVNGEEERRREGDEVPLPLVAPLPDRERERAGRGKEAARRSSTPTAACVCVDRRATAVCDHRDISQSAVLGNETRPSPLPSHPHNPTSSMAPCGCAKAVAVMPSAARSHALR